MKYQALLIGNYELLLQLQNFIIQNTVVKTLQFQLVQHTLIKYLLLPSSENTKMIMIQSMPSSSSGETEV